MDHSLLKSALHTANYQMTKAFEGLSEERGDFDLRICPEARTAREILEHLCDCYQGYMDMSHGKQYEWGSFKAEGYSALKLLDIRNELRKKAESFALAHANDPKSAEFALGFLVLHETYHVGQMCLLHIKVDPNWNPYSIYEGYEDWS